MIWIHPFEHITVEVLCMFTDYLADRPTITKFSTVAQYMNGLKDLFLCRWDQKSRDLLDSTLFKAHLLGVEKRFIREQPPPPRSDFEHLFAAPKGRITSKILHELIPLFPNKTITDHNTIDLIITAQQLLLRLGEVTSTQGNKGEVPVAADFRWISREVRTLFLAKSKTDKKQAGTELFAHKNNDRLDPVKAMDNIFWRSHAQDKTPYKPFFCTEEGTPITATSVRRTLKEALARAGYNPRQFSGHSLRRGGAQDLFNARIPLADIMALGRWTSSSWLRYVSMPRAKRIAIMNARVRSIAAG